MSFMFKFYSNKQRKGVVCLIRKNIAATGKNSVVRHNDNRPTYRDGTTDGSNLTLISTAPTNV